MSGGGQAPVPFQPPNQAGAAAGQQAGTNALATGGQQLQATAGPGFQNIYGAVQNNPYYAGAQAGAGTAATGGSNLYNTSMANAGALSNLGQNLGQYGNQIIQTGFDPQQALYNQQYQQNTDQTNAINSMYGVGGSPYGAGLANQSSQNFNINWQNQQQQRQNAAIQALGQLSQTQAGLFQGGQNLGDSALQMLQSTSAAPSSTYLGNQQAISQALQQLVSGTTGAYGLTQQATGDESSYLGLGQQASQGALQSWKAQQQANNQIWSTVGSMLGMAGQIGLGVATGGASLPFTSAMDMSGVSGMGSSMPEGQSMMGFQPDVNLSSGVGPMMA
jgi:hypothetical protein